MKWTIPPIIKIYEALGSIADKRIEIEGNSAKVYSSNKDKSYDVVYDPETNAIMSNDNGSYWVGYLGYPSVAFLMLKGLIKYDKKYSEALKGIEWKNINTKFKNDFDKTEEFVREIISKKGIELSEFDKELKKIMLQVKKLDMNLLGKKTRPP